MATYHDNAKEIDYGAESIVVRIDFVLLGQSRNEEDYTKYANNDRQNPQGEGPLAPGSDCTWVGAGGASVELRSDVGTARSCSR